MFQHGGGAGASNTDASCAELTAMPAVFVLALGRSGSSHLLRILNAIEGYRISGETDNAWIHAGRFVRAHAPRGRGEPLAGATLLPCDIRRTLLQLHNPPPRARVFGFKEIYSPFVRRPDSLREVLEHGVASLRTLFPRAKIVFHWRHNLTRVTSSDFWRHDARVAGSEANFRSAVEQYRSYAEQHQDHSFCSTLEGIVKKRSSELPALFRFLGEDLTPALRRIATQPLTLHDWAERQQRRRMRNGTEATYAFTQEAEATAVARRSQAEKERLAKVAAIQQRVAAIQQRMATRRAQGAEARAQAAKVRAKEQAAEDNAIRERARLRHEARHARHEAAKNAQLLRGATGSARGAARARRGRGRGAGRRGTPRSRRPAKGKGR